MTLFERTIAGKGSNPESLPVTEAFKLAEEGRGILMIRKMIKRGQKAIEFYYV